MRLISTLRPLTALLAASLGYSFASAQGIKMDPLTLYPTASLSYGHNDNVLLTPARQTSNTTVFTAGLKAELKSAKDTYSIGYDGTFGRYASASVDNYNYHDFKALADMDLSTRARLMLGADHTIRSDPRGSLPTAATPSPNEHRQSGVNALFSYGAAGAQGRFEINGGYTVKRYESEKVTAADGTWRHLKISLKPNNPDFVAIELTCDDEGSVQVVAELLEVVG